MNKDTDYLAPNQIKLAMPGTQSKASRLGKPGKQDPLKEEKANQTKWIQKCHTGVLELIEQNKTIVHIFQNLLETLRLF